MKEAAIANMMRRVNRMLRIMELINQMYAARTAAQIDWYELRLKELIKEQGT